MDRAMKVVVLLVLAILHLTMALPANQKPKADECGYASCHAGKPGMLNVHLVPHTHDDVGWLKTIDQYFYGSRSNIQRAGVQYIIDSVVRELQKDPTRKFIYVETAYLWQWWQEQTEEVREQVKTLVNTGQLEFISGGWSMNDEAVTHYQSTVDQFTWGLRKLNDTFGACGRPHIGWQIDPFGHARETASILAHMGFDGLFFARLDYDDRNKRMLDKTPELVWQASTNQGASSWLFTNVLYYFYGAPPGFCFDIVCDDLPIIDNTMSPDYNVLSRVNEFIELCETQARSYTTENILITMGGDFTYQDANVWYKNMDKLISYVNAQQGNGSRLNLLYSTPSCYLKAVNDEKLTYTTKQDDFFPYASDPHTYWTGYYTSRPTLKYFERMGNNLLQVVKQLWTLAGLGPEEWEDISSLREMMGVMQHHDAITGTEKQHVAEDYALRLSQAFEDGQRSTERALNVLMNKGDSPVVDMKACLLSNISQCEVTETSERFVVTLYNPLGRPTSHFVRLPIAEQSSYQVFDPAGEELEVQLVPIPETLLNIPGRTSPATHELLFRAVDLPALGFKSYHVQKVQAAVKYASMTVTGEDRFTIGNKKMQATLDPETGTLRSISVNDIELPMQHTFLYYEGEVGDNSEASKRSSGAYIFRPRNNEPSVVSDNADVTTVKGPLVEEIHQKFSDWVSQVIRSYTDTDYLEMEWLVGPIPTEGDYGKEVISKFSTSWPTDGVCFTDSNGRERLERKLNFRATWPADIKEAVAGNYYPITTAISIKNGDSELAVLVDRAQGGGSINDGEIELMVHRRLLKDDAFGVDEALDEHAFESALVARGRHIIHLGNSSSSPTSVARQRQLVQEQMVLPAWVVISLTDLSAQEWRDTYNMEYAGLNSPLPDNVHLLTLEPWKDGTGLLRLEHPYENTDDPVLSETASVTIEELFKPFIVTDARETTLGGNQWLNESSRLTWAVEGGDEDSQQLWTPGQQTPERSNRMEVVLEPMQIRTFVVNIPFMSGATRHVQSQTLLALIGLALFFLKNFN